jgi:hypothetical protein
MRFFWLLIALTLAACTVERAKTDRSPPAASSTRTVVASWESVSVRRDSTLSAESPSITVDDSTYNALLAANTLPEEKTAATVRLAPNDTIDMSNFQSSGWWLGVGKDGSRRFSADYERYTSGMLVLTLDTTLVRNQRDAPFDTKRADSIAASGLGRTERFSSECKFGAHSTDERITGLVRDSTPEIWTRPRLAWLFDTAYARIRRMRPDSIACMLMPDPD